MMTSVVMDGSMMVTPMFTMADAMLSDHQTTGPGRVLPYSVKLKELI